MIEKPDCLVCGRPGVRAYTGCRDFFCGSPGEYAYLRCGPCDLLWVSPHPSPEDLCRLYEEYYSETLLAPDSGDSVSGLKAWLRRSILAGLRGYPTDCDGPPRASERLLGNVLGRLPVVAHRACYGLGLLIPPYRAGGRLLEVGCGTGWYVKLMQDLGWEAVGLDVDSGATERGSRRYGVPLRSGTLEEQKLPDGSFDAIAMQHVFEHVPDPLATLRECRRLLRPGGWLGLAMPNAASLASRWFGRHWRGLTVPWHLHLFSPRAIRHLLERAGFTGLRVRTRTLSEHWVYTASRRIRAGTYRRDEIVPSCWWFHWLATSANAVSGRVGEELQATAIRGAE